MVNYNNNNYEARIRGLKSARAKTPGYQQRICEKCGCMRYNPCSCSGKGSKKKDYVPSNLRARQQDYDRMAGSPHAFAGTNMKIEAFTRPGSNKK